MYKFQAAGLHTSLCQNAISYLCARCKQHTSEYSEQQMHTYLLAKKCKVKEMP